MKVFPLQTSYYSSHPRQNYNAIVPKGGPAWWEEPHDRHRKFPAVK